MDNIVRDTYTELKRKKTTRTEGTRGIEEQKRNIITAGSRGPSPTASSI